MRRSYPREKHLTLAVDFNQRTIRDLLTIELGDQTLNAVITLAGQEFKL